ncbi:hypothetical protein SHIRM173S_02582 [Streptomyces hirsutus]
MRGQPVDEALHLGQLVGVVERTEEDVLVVGGTRLRVGGGLGEGGDELVVDRLVDEDTRGGRTVLAGVEEARDGDVLHGLGDVGVLEDDDRRLAAQLQVDALEVLGRGLGDLHAGPHRTGDGRHRRGLVLDHHAAGVAVAADDVEDAVGRTEPRISASRTVEAGVVSEGLRTTVLPAAIAGANFHTAIIIG